MDNEITISDSADWNIGSGDFTLEGQVKIDSSTKQLIRSQSMKKKEICVSGAKAYIDTNFITNTQLAFFKKQFTYKNPSYKQNKKLGISTFGTPQFYALYDIVDDILNVPRGLLQKITDYFDSQDIKYILHSDEPHNPKIDYGDSIVLRTEQVPIVKEMLTHSMGVYTAPCGIGKTIIGLKIIAERKCSALILVHTKELLNQWLERIKEFYDHDAGIIGDNKYDVKPLTVGLMQTVVNNVDTLKDEFDLLFVDEAHHAPCDTMYDIVIGMNAWYRYGATATPTRKDKKEFMLFATLGSIKYEANCSENTLTPKVYMADTGYYFPYYRQPDTDIDKIVYHCKRYGEDIYEKCDECKNQATRFCDFENAYNSNLYKCKFKLVYEGNYVYLSTQIGNNRARNLKMLAYMLHAHKNGAHILALFDRKAAITFFEKCLKVYKIPYGVLIGTSTKKGAEKRKQTLIDFKHERIRIILATKVADEGLDLPILDTIMLNAPSNNDGLVKQRIGRAVRPHSGKKLCRAIYFWDAKQFPWQYKKLSKSWDVEIIETPQEIIY